MSYGLRRRHISNPLPVGARRPVERRLRVSKAAGVATARRWVGQDMAGRVDNRTIRVCGCMVTITRRKAWVLHCERHVCGGHV